MKKLHVINLGKLGGAEKIFLEYLKSNSSGQDDILCISNHIGAEIKPHLAGYNVTYANRIFNNFKIKYPAFLRKFFLKKKIDSCSADKIIIWDLVPNFRHKPLKGQIIYYDHGCSWRFPHTNKTQNFFNMVDRCIAVSHASQRVMELRFNLSCPIKIIPNSLIFPKLSYRKTNGLFVDKITLGTASRLVSLKGISVSILTIKELISRGINAELIIAGKGPNESSLKNLVQTLNLEDKVKFIGFQDNLNDFYQKIDIYMSTPATEPFGLSCLESLYYNTPVLFPLIDGQPEVMSEPTDGIGLVPTIDFTTHAELTGTVIDFPHHVYDPINDALVPPKMLSHLDCADALINYINKNTITNISIEREIFDYKKFIVKLDDGFCSK